MARRLAPGRSSEEHCPETTSRASPVISPGHKYATRARVQERVGLLPPATPAVHAQRKTMSRTERTSWNPRGIPAGLIAMPSTTMGTLVLAAGLVLYVAGLFGPLGDRNQP
jgi:hypothetical protein